jgi:hypothetical protein
MQSNTFALNASTIIIDSSTNSGKIALGSTPPTSVAYTSNAGIYMDGTGDFLAYGDDDNFIKKDGTALTIASETFDLNSGGKLILNSTQPELQLLHSNARLTLGATANTSIEGSNKGIYMDGGGDFLLYGSAANYFKFDATGTSIDIKTDTFDLDATTLIMTSDASSPYGTFKLGPSGGPGSATGTSNAGAYLDGLGKFNFVGDSNNYVRFNATGLEIQTPNFTASSAGDVTISGTINASAGAFSGNITSTATITGGTLKTTNERAQIASTTGLIPDNTDMATTLGTIMASAEDVNLPGSGTTWWPVVGDHDFDTGVDIVYAPVYGTPLQSKVELHCKDSGAAYGRVHLSVSQSTETTMPHHETDPTLWTNAATYVYTNISKTTDDWRTYYTLINPISGCKWIRLELQDMLTQEDSAGSSGLSDSDFDYTAENEFKSWTISSLASNTVMNETGIAISAGADSYSLLGGAGAIFQNTVEIKKDLKLSGQAYKPGGGSWLSLSDNRIKNITDDFTDGLSIIQKITPLRYEYKDDENKIEHIGVIAQELEKIAPYAVSKVASEEHNLTDLRVINESNLTYMLINSIKELSKKVEDLENEIRIIKTS